MLNYCPEKIIKVVVNNLYPCKRDETRSYKHTKSSFRLPVFVVYRASSALMKTASNSSGRKKHELTTFSEVFLHKFSECCSICLTLDREHRDAEGVWENIKNLKNGSIQQSNFSHHRACYSALTNIKRAQLRCQFKNTNAKKLILWRWKRRSVGF